MAQDLLLHGRLQRPSQGRVRIDQTEGFGALDQELLVHQQGQELLQLRRVGPTPARSGLGSEHPVHIFGRQPTLADLGQRLFRIVGAVRGIHWTEGTGHGEAQAGECQKGQS